MAKIKDFTDESGRLHILFSGSIDAATVTDLDAYITKKLEKEDSLILDMKDVTYVSSAGLRLILKTDLVLKEKGGFFIENLSDEVYETFKLVNFHRFLHIVGKEEDRDEAKDEAIKDDGIYTVGECELSDTDRAALPANFIAYLSLKKLNSLGIFNHSGDALVKLVEELNEESVRLGIIFNNETSKSIDFEKMLSVLEEYYKSKDIEKMSVGIFGTKDDYGKTLTACSYTDHKEYFQISADREEILKSPFLAKAEKLSAELPKVKAYNELSDAQKMILTFNFGIENDESLDPVFSKFFTTEDEVKGVLLGREITDNLLVVYSINAMADKDSKLAVPLMLASFLKVCETFLDEGARIFFVCHTENQCKSLIKALEISDDYEVIGEYTKDLNAYWD